MTKPKQKIDKLIEKYNKETDKDKKKWIGADIEYYSKIEEEIRKIKADTRILKEHRTEKNRPTLWYNKKIGLIEIHFNNKTILCDVKGIDKETIREQSDDMALGSGFKQVLYKTDIELLNEETQ